MCHGAVLSPTNCCFGGCFREHVCTNYGNHWYVGSVHRIWIMMIIHIDWFHGFSKFSNVQWIQLCSMNSTISIYSKVSVDKYIRCIWCIQIFWIWDIVPSHGTCLLPNILYIFLILYIIDFERSNLNMFYIHLCPSIHSFLLIYVHINNFWPNISQMPVVSDMIRYVCIICAYATNVSNFTDIWNV